MTTKPRRRSPSSDQKAAFIRAAEAAEADTDEARWEARLKAAAKPAFGTNGMTHKMEAETGKRIAKSMDTLEKTKPKASKAK